jgi:hypothetical protein
LLALSEQRFERLVRKAARLAAIKEGNFSSSRDWRWPGVIHHRDQTHLGMAEQLRGSSATPKASELDRFPSLCKSSRKQWEVGCAAANRISQIHMNSGSRYAIYFVPAADQPLFRFGRAVLGYDCYR